MLQLPQTDELLAAVPGELVVGATTIGPDDSAPSDLRIRFQNAIGAALGGDFRVGPPAGDREAEPSTLVFAGPDGTVQAFELITIQPAERAPEAANVLNSDRGQAAFASQRLQSPRAHLNWYSTAQPNCIGGSPGSYPVPLQPPETKRLRYRPRLGELSDDQLADEGRRAIKVAVLDTRPPDPLRTNEQYFDLQAHFTNDPPNAGRTYRDARLALPNIGDMWPIERQREDYDTSQHGLFVSSVVYAVAPWADIQLIRVLNDHGVGSLDVLLRALSDLVANKAPAAPLIVNLSLGMLPPLEQLPAILRQGLVPGIQGRPQPAPVRLDERMLADNPPEVDVLLSLRPLVELLLHHHNCLVVAAAGNDSAGAYASSGRRWNPRAPACYDTVVGVAATTRDADVVTSYSNIGDIPVLGNGFATFGGGTSKDGDADSGVSGLFSAGPAGFPEHVRTSGVPGLDSGWAQWSGTSFATPMMAGMAANYWARQWQASGGPSAATVLAGLKPLVESVHHQPVLSDVQAPSVPVDEVWQ